LETNEPQSKQSILSEFAETTNNNIQSNSHLHDANAIQLKCAQVGFDWPNAVPVFDKIMEELEEVKEAIANPNKNKADVEEELGDLLFACVNLCRHLNVSPDDAISFANQKFVKRFQQIELILQAQGKHTEDQSLDNLEALWQSVKREV